MKKAEEPTQEEEVESKESLVVESKGNKHEHIYIKSITTLNDDDDDLSFSSCYQAQTQLFFSVSFSSDTGDSFPSS